MNAPVPTALKPVAKYILRAKELLNSSKGNEVVAYQCLAYAVELAIKNYNDNSPEVTKYLTLLMDELERLKAQTPGLSKEDRKAICQEFALSVFDRADSIDAVGNANMSTAKSFYAAATFFEIMAQFEPNNELDSELKDRIKYSKWRGAEILAAMKEGRKPVPGDFKTENNATRSSFVVSDNANATSPIADAFPAKDIIPSSSFTQASPSPPPVAPRNSVPSMPRRTSQVQQQKSGYNHLSNSQKSDALEYIKFARAALEADDVEVTVERLQKALEILHH